VCGLIMDSAGHQQPALQLSPIRMVSKGLTALAESAMCHCRFATNADIHYQHILCLLTCTGGADVDWVALFLTLSPLPTPEAQGAAEAPFSAPVG
jgi:hypothetical protein